MNKRAKIYTLSDPDTKEVRYVGKTNNLPGRLYKYRNLKGSRSPNIKWIETLLEKGKFPIVSVIEVCPTETADERECYWIQFWKSRTRLLNITKGGRGGATTTGMILGPHSKKTRMKISLAKTGKRLNMTTEQLKARGQKIAAIRKRNGTTNLGMRFTWSNKSRVNASKAAKKRVLTKEGRAQIIKAGRIQADNKRGKILCLKH